jgi:hypothetical protein
LRGFFGKPRLSPLSGLYTIVQAQVSEASQVLVELRFSNLDGAEVLPPTFFVVVETHIPDYKSINRVKFAEIVYNLDAEVDLRFLRRR